MTVKPVKYVPTLSYSRRILGDPDIMNIIIFVYVT